LDGGPRKPTLVEQRRIDAAQLAQPLADEARVAVLTAPLTPAHILAAQLDLAEREDLKSAVGPRPARPVRLASRVPKRAVRSAADEFNRWFGVLAMAPN
jgi:hypothetical protein